MSYKRFFGLSWFTARMGLKMSIEGKRFGFLWHFITPLVSFILLLGLFQNNLGANIPNYALYILVGLLLFGIFENITRQSLEVIFHNGSIIKSINFPIKTIIMGGVMRILVLHMIELAILIGFLIYFKISIVFLVFYPLVLLLLTIFSVGIALSLSAIRIYFSDLNEIWGFVVRGLWFLSAIFYSAEGHRFHYLNIINPLYYFITLGREIIIYNRFPELNIILGTMIFTLAAILSGLYIFNKLEKGMVERI